MPLSGLTYLSDLGSPIMTDSLQ